MRHNESSTSTTYANYELETAKDGLILVGDPGFKEDALERRVANAMDMYRQGLHHDGDGTMIFLDAVVLTGDKFEDQQFKEAANEVVNILKDSQ